MPDGALFTSAAVLPISAPCFAVPALRILRLALAMPSLALLICFPGLASAVSNLIVLDLPCPILAADP